MTMLCHITDGPDTPEEVKEFNFDDEIQADEDRKAWLETDIGLEAIDNEQ